MGRKFFTKKLSNFLIVSFICLVIIFINPQGFFSPLKIFIFKLAYPLQKTLYLAGNSVSSYWNFASALTEIKKENEKLIKEKYLLQGELDKLKEQKKENEILRSQLELAPRDKFELEASFVIGQDPQGLGSWIMLDKGKSDGIESGMPVIFSQGILIGKIEDVFSHSSKVLLLSHAESNVNAVNLETGARGILRGEYGLGLMLDLVSQKEVLNVGDTVVTSGLGGNVPKGLSLGKIQELHSSADKLFQQAVVIPTVKAQNLEVVFIIKR